MYPLIKVTGCRKYHWLYRRVWNVNLFLLGTTARKQTYKKILWKQVLPQGCLPRLFPNSVSRKAVMSQKQSFWRAVMDSTANFVIMWLLREWVNDLANDREDSETPLVLFQSLPDVRSHWLKCNSKSTPPRLAKTMLQLASWQTAYNNKEVFFVDLFVWWINVKMPLDIYIWKDCIILIVLSNVKMLTTVSRTQVSATLTL